MATQIFVNRPVRDLRSGAFFTEPGYTFNPQCHGPATAG
jgi:predicted lactoylglutathione lyase